MNKKAKIVMNSMVGNEQVTITRMLESVAPYIDYWVIQCNGNDDTQRIIEEFFGNRKIPGFTYKVEWKFPGWNRDHALQECLKANHGCDWILRMDADERLHVDLDFDWSVIEDTSIQSFNIIADASDTLYFRTWFWNAKLPWFFQHDKRHETIHLPEIGENFQRISMPNGFKHMVSQDGETWAVPRKFLKDALELESDKVVGNTVLQDTYHLWYIAKSYADCYGNVSEMPFGKKHSDEYARRSNWYFERFLEVSYNWGTPERKYVLDEMGYFTFICMAWNHQFIGSPLETILKLYEHAEEFAEGRNEALFYKASYLDQIGMYKETLEVVDFLLTSNRKNPFPEKSFLIENRCYADTSNILVGWKEKLERILSEHVISSESFKFTF
jgi:glycosyltransferase involved in cell wall biosynthesis